MLCVANVCIKAGFSLFCLFFLYAGKHMKSGKKKFLFGDLGAINKSPNADVVCICISPEIMSLPAMFVSSKVGGTYV